MVFWLDRGTGQPYSRAHDQRRDHSHRSPPPQQRGTGGRLRLRSSPLPPDPLRGLSLAKNAVSSGGSYVKQEFEMYTPPMFKPDRAASLGFAEARGFGTVCAWDGSKP